MKKLKKRKHSKPSRKRRGKTPRPPVKRGPKTPS